VSSVQTTESDGPSSNEASTHSVRSRNASQKGTNKDCSVSPIKSIKRESSKSTPKSSREPDTSVRKSMRQLQSPENTTPS